MVFPIEQVPDIDLGHDHYLTFTRWAPDDLPANRERYGYPLPVVEKWGATVRHYRQDPGRHGEMCEGAFAFDGEWQQKLIPADHRWTVESWEPLTVSPSILCLACGDHGFIRQGKWVPA